MERSRPRTAALVCVLAAAALSAAWVFAGAAGDANDGKPQATNAGPAARLLERGWAHLELVNYPMAQEAFEKALEAAPDAEQRAEALFALAHLWQYRQPGADIDKAREIYERVAAELAETRAAPLALMALARLADAPDYESDRDREKARTLYRQVIQRFPSHFLADEAVLRLALTYLEELGNTASEDAGAKLLTDHLARDTDNSLGPAMRWELGNLHFNRAEYREAIREWMAADALDAKAPEGRAMSLVARAGLYYRIAKTCEKRLKDYATAAVWYEKIVTDVRRENRYYISKLAAARCRKLAAEHGQQPTTQPAAGGKAPR